MILKLSSIRRVPLSSDIDFVSLLPRQRGGDSEIYEAIQTHLGRSVYVEIFARSERTQREDEERFVRRALLMAKLRHHAVLPVLDIARTESGCPYIVYPKATINGWRSGTKPRVIPRLAYDLSILLQVSRCIEHAHSQGILHLDLKPDNFGVEPDGHAMVGEWQLAVYEEELDSNPMAGLCGTPQYMAPETATKYLRYLQACEQRKLSKGDGLNALGDAILSDGDPISKRTDVYCLGGVLHWVLYGRPPRKASSTLKCLEMASMGRRRPIVLDGPLQRIVAKAMSADPQERFCDAGAFSRAVEEAMYTMARREPLP